MSFLDFLKKFKKDKTTHGAGGWGFGRGAESGSDVSGQTARDQAMREQYRSFDQSLQTDPAPDFDAQGNYIGKRVSEQIDNGPQRTYRLQMHDALKEGGSGWSQSGGKNPTRQ